MRISLNKTPESVSSKKTSNQGKEKNLSKDANRGSSANESTLSKPEVQDDTLLREVAKNSSILSKEKDIQYIDDEEVITALAALDDVGMVQTTYESHGAKAVENDVADESEEVEDGDMSTSILLERLRQNIETHEFLNSRL